MLKNYITIAMFAGAMLLMHQTSAQESKFKALFIYKFAEYIEWPSGSKNVTVGVVGTSDVLDQLQSLAGQKENLTVSHISSPPDASNCSILFFPKGHESEVLEYKSTLGDNSVLLVSETSELTGKGSDIGFYLEGGRLRFLISEKDIKAKKMIPSSKLLALGKAI